MFEIFQAESRTLLDFPWEDRGRSKLLLRHIHSRLNSTSRIVESCESHTLRVDKLQDANQKLKDKEVGVGKVEEAGNTLCN